MASISGDRARYSSQNVAFFSQTNSASGYPLNYRNFDDQQKVSILRSKVKGMVVQGNQKCSRSRSRFVLFLRGIRLVFVKEMATYLELGLIPTGRFIREELLDDPESLALLNKVHVRDFCPGDMLDLSDGKVTKAFVASEDYTETQLKDATVRYYSAMGSSIAVIPTRRSRRRSTKTGLPIFCKN